MWESLAFSSENMSRKRKWKRSWEVEGGGCSREQRAGRLSLQQRKCKRSWDVMEIARGACNRGNGSGICSLQLWSRTHAIATTLWAYATVGIKRVMGQRERQEEAI
jgi:hypothetical protein